MGTSGLARHRPSQRRHRHAAAVEFQRVALIGTCKINGIEPFAYMKATLEARDTDKGFEIGDQRFGAFLPGGAATSGEAPRICFSIA